MGLFNFFKSSDSSEKKSEKVVRVTISQDEQATNDFMAKLRAERIEENKPVLSRGPVQYAPVLTSSRFQFDNVLIATVWGKNTFYLLDGSNAASFFEDLEIINTFAREANMINPSLPRFEFDPAEIVLVPVVLEGCQTWTFSHLTIEGLSNTGKQKKYPFSIVAESIIGARHGRFYYDQSGNLGKGRITVPNPDIDAQEQAYSIEFGNGKLLRISVLTRNHGRQMLYNANERVLP